jgi:polysaccharide pyruvyl transferase WcaK-like protein
MTWSYNLWGYYQIKLRVLLVGYNGANNTGAEAKFLVSIDEIRSVLGQEACITVPSLNEENLRRYLTESSTLKIKSIRPSVIFLDIRRLVKENDLIMLVEGSCYMDTWGSALLWYYLLATRYAHSMKKHCIATSISTKKVQSSYQKRKKKLQLLRNHQKKSGIKRAPNKFFAIFHIMPLQAMLHRMHLPPLGLNRFPSS